MKTTAAKTGGRAKYYVIAVSTILAHTRFSNTVRIELGKFDTQEEARKVANLKAHIPGVVKSHNRIRFDIRHNGCVIESIQPKQRRAI